MSTKELPDTEIREMDEKHLAELIYKATVAFNEFVKSNQFESEITNVYRSAEQGHEPLQRPKLSDALFKFQDERLLLPSVRALMDYLWEHGALKNTFTCDDGEPDRAGWESFAFTDVVVQPLWRLWHEYSLRSLSSNGNWNAWDVPDASVIRLAENGASIAVGKGRWIRIVTPFLQLSLQDVEQFELEPNIFIRKWSNEDKALYLHRYGHYYPWDDVFSLNNMTCYLEVFENSNQIYKTKESDEDLEEFVASTVCRAKWAIMQATNPMQLIFELPTIADNGISASTSFPLRRHAMRRQYGVGISLDIIGCEKAKSLLQTLSKATAIFKEFQDVLLMFDRATLARIPRDILLESVIGLELLLVNGSGENTRRFHTFGHALIGSTNARATTKQLKDIYGLRSSAAHGGTKTKSDFQLLGSTARAYLAEAIANVAKLVLSKHIRPDPELKENVLSRSVECYLNSAMFSATQKDLQNCGE